LFGRVGSVLAAHSGYQASFPAQGRRENSALDGGVSARDLGEI
jgi:hypothetical protein